MALKHLVLSELDTKSRQKLELAWRAMEVLQDRGTKRAGSWHRADSLDYTVTAFPCPDSKLYQKHKVKAKNIRSIRQSLWARSYFQELPPQIQLPFLLSLTNSSLHLQAQSFGRFLQLLKEAAKQKHACAAQLLPLQWAVFSWHPRKKWVWDTSLGNEMAEGLLKLRVHTLSQCLDKKMVLQDLTSASWSR